MLVVVTRRPADASRARFMDNGVSGAPRRGRRLLDATTKEAGASEEVQLETKLRIQAEKANATG